MGPVICAVPGCGRGLSQRCCLLDLLQRRQLRPCLAPPRAVVGRAMTSPHPTGAFFEADKRRPARRTRPRAVGRTQGLMGLKRSLRDRKWKKGVRGKLRDFKGLQVGLGLTGLTGLKFPPTRMRARKMVAEGERKYSYALRSDFQSRQSRQSLICLYPSVFIELCFSPISHFSSPDFDFQSHQSQRKKDQDQYEAVK